MPMNTPSSKDPMWGQRVDYPFFLSPDDFLWLQRVLGPSTEKDVQTAIELCVEERSPEPADQ